MSADLVREAGQPGPRPPWYVASLAGLIACGLGLMGLGIAAWLQLARAHHLTDFPDPRVTVPFLVVTLAAACVSFARRERLWQLSVAGIAMAASALMLGWVLVTAIVALAALVVILAVSHFC